MPDLDIGQPGSARLTAKEACFMCHVLLGREEQKSVVNAIPQQAAVIEDVMGPGEIWWRWSGSLKVDAVATLYEIEDLCRQLKHGYARSGGAVGVFDPNNIQATTLKDSSGTTLSTRARIDGFNRSPEIHKLYGNAVYGYLVKNFTVTFRGL